MRSNHSYIVYFLFVMFFHWGYFTMAQTNEQKALESKREQLQKEISEINRLLFAEKKEKSWNRWRPWIKKSMFANS